MNSVIDFINTNRDKYVDKPKRISRSPASARSQHAGDVKRCAEWTADDAAPACRTSG
jgi:hypothetical protein